MKPAETVVLIFYSIVALCTIVGLTYAISTDPPVRHNICTIAEISPDVTPEERKRCRQIRGHKL
jgi:hypothetical protein